MGDRPRGVGHAPVSPRARANDPSVRHPAHPSVVTAGDTTIEELANTAALDNACVDPASFVDRAFAALLARSPNSVEKRDLLARMRTGASRPQIVARILRAEGFRQSVCRHRT